MADERELGLQQRAKELLTKRLAETAEWGEAWTVEQYDLVFKAVEFASKSGVGDVRDEVGALSLFNDLQEKVKAYEVAEGSRRAQEKFRRDQEECKAWVAKLAQFDKTVREAKMCVGELKKRSWDEATAEPDLNGPLMTPAVKNNASKALWLFPDKLHVAQRGLQALLLQGLRGDRSRIRHAPRVARQRGGPATVRFLDWLVMAASISYPRRLPAARGCQSSAEQRSAIQRGGA